MRAAHPDLVISVDTWRAGVARVVIDAGADLLNDTWAGADPELVPVAAAGGVGLVCSHTGGLGPRTDPHRVAYDDVVADVVAVTTGAAERAVAAGVRRDAILIDPTHDFGKNTYHSLELTRRLDELTATGWPVLVALSRKDFIGETLDLPADERLHGTLGRHRDLGLARRARVPHPRRPRHAAGSRHRRVHPRRPPARRRASRARVTSLAKSRAGPGPRDALKPWPLYSPNSARTASPSSGSTAPRSATPSTPRP